ncbi:hypothetical protein [Alcaligenes endophyticus]|uniref:Uncharacterized protein n=1 Tax=Alcaligenes endophyticus TaxID=1929088 RepID=A0ABT8EKC7_9BURK|nr:hypothetical protein [Alcaligenes endophyticus]MCX5590885.1 hypothetical protein [Alcaligenes endophyticus]MDN4121752.1 hypothetical protein [Alcaligenes endophyticus]
MTNCTCPSGDGSLRWPCPAHPPLLDPIDEILQALDLARGQIDGAEIAPAFYNFDYLTGIMQMARELKQPTEVIAEPVATVGSCYQLLWAGGSPIASLVKRHNLKPGSELYAAPVAAQVQPCQHRFMWFGDQKKQRCADCCIIEPDDQAQQDAASIHLQDLKNAVTQNTELRQQLNLMEEHARGKCWRWQGDGTDDLSTMGNRMGVLIYACDLRALLAAQQSVSGADGLDERSAFEEWAAGIEIYVGRYKKTGEYVSGEAELAYNAWKARAALVEGKAQCRCIRYGKGNPHWPCKLHPERQPASSDHIAGAGNMINQDASKADTARKEQSCE